MQTITTAELRSLMDRAHGPLIVEALPESSYKQGHLPGAINLPPDQVRDRAAGLLPDKEASIVVYCGGPT